MSGQARIIGVGHCCQDTICVIERYPEEDSSTHILSMDDSQGGGAVATAIAAAGRLGAGAAMMACLGDDPAGDKIMAGFEAFGVDTRYIRRIKGGRSSTSIVMVDPVKGTRTKFPYRDDLPALPFDDEQRQAIRDCAVLHLDGTRYENALNAARIAKEYQVTVSLDGCSRQKDNALNLALARLADILIMNAVYPRAVSGCDSDEGALRFFGAMGPKKAVVMTKGAEGCMALINGEIRRFKAFPVPAEDTTGAGDVFHGAFLTRYLEGYSVPDCIRYASAAAALKCTRPGGRAGIPTRGSLEAFLARYA